MKSMSTPGDRQRVAERNEFAGALGGQNSGHPGGGQGITLGQPVGADHRDDIRSGVHCSRGHRDPIGDVLGGDVDHVGRARLVEMREAEASSPSEPTVTC